VLFERGAFDAAATIAVSEALAGFAFGLPAFVLVRVLQPGFFSRADTRTPTLLAGLSMVVNVVVSLALFPTLEHIAIALATSIAAWVNVILLALLLARRGHFRLDAGETGRLAGILAAAVVMGLLLWAVALWAAPVFAPGASFALQFVSLGALVGLGAALYFATLHFTGIHRLDMILTRLRRR